MCMCTVYYTNSVFITNTATQMMHSYGTCRQCAYVESCIIILGMTTPALCEGGLTRMNVGKPILWFVVSSSAGWNGCVIGQALGR